MTSRVAIYFTPPRDSPLSLFAASWLGRDAAADIDVARCKANGLDATCHEAITRSPRHYGFHATLKAPFTLADDCSLEDVRHALANFVSGKQEVTGAPLVLRDVDGFLALVFSKPSDDVDNLAGDCVETFERFRAPLSQEDIDRRRATGLSHRQDELLLRWGYPYVFDEFRFHMTLTERLDDAKRTDVASVLAPKVAPFCQSPFAIDAISLAHQSTRSAPFVVVDRFPLLG